MKFTSRVGVLSPFFAARTSDTAPSATMTGPTGDYALDVVESPKHPEFGERWQINPPSPWWCEGDYTISVSSGEVYEVHVGRRRKTLSPAEVGRLSALDLDQLAETLAAFGPQKES